MLVAALVVVEEEGKIIWEVVAVVPLKELLNLIAHRLIIMLVQSLSCPFFYKKKLEIYMIG